MAFRYFAYGSNLWAPRMRSRCPTARLIGPAVLDGWVAGYVKPGADGTAKLGIRPRLGGRVAGVVYEIDDRDRAALDAAEEGYDAIETSHGLTYAYGGVPTSTRPAGWYVSTVERGARSHGLPTPVDGGR